MYFDIILTSVPRRTLMTRVLQCQSQFTILAEGLSEADPGSKIVAVGCRARAGTCASEE